ncbi:MAG: methyltransferase [Rhodanobacter sp.]
MNGKCEQMVVRRLGVALLAGLSMVVLAGWSGGAVAQQVLAASSMADQPDGALVPPVSASAFTATQLDNVLAGNQRSATNRARDVYRHPKATLQFFGIRPDQTVIEIAPGGGWYSEILAPLLHNNGRYIAAVAAPAAAKAGSQSDSPLQKKFAADPAHYENAQWLQFQAKAPVLGKPDSADRVLTFRNVHNWIAADTAPAMFKAFFAVLRPGGVLGVVEHRADEPTSLASMKQSGYVSTAYVVKLATEAGFVADGSSEINANPKDTKNYPKGVWTLPPTLELGAQNRSKYLAIGESDRMTLRFIKPAVAAPASVTR